MNHANVSDHTPVAATVNISMRRQKNNTIPPPSKPVWDKCDVAAYRSRVGKYISHFTPENEAQLRVLINNVTSTLKDAELQSISNRKPKRTKKNIPWSPEAYTKSKSAHWKWKTGGRPGNPKHPLHLNKQNNSSEVHRGN